MNTNPFKYFDIQVNGYAGIDFNSMNLNLEQLQFACKKLKEDNVEGILATLITDDFEKMLVKIINLSNIIHNDSFIKSVIKGIHIEGPFLNPSDGYRGAHQKEFIISTDIEKAKEIIDAGDGLIKLFTLAPENDNNYKTIKYLSKNNVIVSAGHSNASMVELKEAIDNGLKMFTHLGNGCPHILPRHDNIVNRVLSLSDKLFICFIADGIHIPEFALKNYLETVDVERSIIVTDCMAAASAAPGKYSIANINVEVGEDKIVREIGKHNLAGSAITMKDSHYLLKEKLRLNDVQLENILYKNSKTIFEKILN